MPFASKRRKQEMPYSRKIKGKARAGFKANKSRHKDVRKSSGDSFTRNPKHSKSGATRGGRAGKGRFSGRRK